jgi:hypothetical protein
MLQASVKQAAVGFGRRGFQSSRAALSGALSSHRHTDDNNESTPFDFTESNYAKVEKILAPYPGEYPHLPLPPPVPFVQFGVLSLK